jgi:hypothetical protein
VSNMYWTRFFITHIYHAWQGCNDTARAGSETVAIFCHALSGSHKVSNKKIQNHVNFLKL